MYILTTDEITKRDEAAYVLAQHLSEMGMEHLEIPIRYSTQDYIVAVTIKSNKAPV